MNRPFLRVYATLAVVVLLVTVAFQWGARRSIERQIDERVSEWIAPQLAALRSRMGDDALSPREVHGLERDASERLGMPVRIESEPPQDPTLRARIDDGEIVVETRGRRREVWARLGDHTYLQVGPSPHDRPPPPRRPRVLGSLAVLALAGLATLALLRPMERRLQRLAASARAFGDGDLTARADDVRDDAIGALAGDFDRMAERIARLVKGQRDLLRAVSHELRTPLARMTLALDEALDAPDDAERHAMLARVERSLDEMRGLVDELLSMGRLEAGDRARADVPVDVHELLADTARLITELDARLDVQVECGDGALTGDARLLRRMLHNLATNAVRFAATKIRLSFRMHDGGAELVVEDDGPGVPHEERARVFDPFARGDESRASALGGVGLGLAIVRQIAEAHGGTAEVDSSALGGARFVVRLGAFRPELDHTRA